MKNKIKPELLIIFIVAVLGILVIIKPTLTGMAVECPEGTVEEGGQCIETAKEEAEIVDGAIEFLMIEQNGKKINQHQIKEKIPFTIFFKVKNTGNAPYKAMIKANIGKLEIKRSTRETLEPGEEKTMNMEIIGGLPGQKYDNFGLTLDRYYTEKILGNNEVSLPLTIVKEAEPVQEWKFKPDYQPGGHAEAPAVVQPEPVRIETKKMDFEVRADSKSLIYLVQQNTYANIANMPENEPFFVTFDIRNAGEERSQPKYVVDMDGTVIEKSAGQIIGPGGSKRIKQAFSGLKFGIHKLALGVLEQPNEENLQNNLKEFTLNVISSKKCPEGYVMEADGTCVETVKESAYQAPAPEPVQTAVSPTPAGKPFEFEKIGDIAIQFDIKNQYNKWFIQDNKYLLASHLQTGKNTLCKVRVTNKGNKDTSAELVALIQDTVIDTKETGTLKPNEERVITFDLGQLTEGAQDLFVRAEPEGKDSQTSNNLIKSPLIVRGYDIGAVAQTPSAPAAKKDLIISQVHINQYKEDLGRIGGGFSWGPGGILVTPDKDVELQVSIPTNLPPTTFDLYVDNKKIQTIGMPYKSSQYSSLNTMKQNLGKLAPGKHTIKLIIDPKNTIEESNEENNVFEKTLWVKEKKGVSDAAYDGFELTYKGAENQPLDPNLIKEKESVKGTFYVRNMGAEDLRSEYRLKVVKTNGKIMQEDKRKMEKIVPGARAGIPFKLNYLPAGNYQIQIEIFPAEGETNLANNKAMIPITVYKEKSNVMLALDSKAILNDADAKRTRQNTIFLYIHLINQGSKSPQKFLKIKYGDQERGIPINPFTKDYWAKTTINVERNKFPVYFIASLEHKDENTGDNMISIPVTVLKDGEYYKLQ